MFFPWFRRFSLGFPRFSCVFPRFSFGFPRFSCVFLWFSIVFLCFPMFSCVFLLTLLKGYASPRSADARVPKPSPLTSFLRAAPRELGAATEKNAVKEQYLNIAKHSQT